MRVVSRYHFEDAFSMDLKPAQNFGTNSAVPLKRDLDCWDAPPISVICVISGEVLASVVRGWVPLLVRFDLRDKKWLGSSLRLY